MRGKSRNILARTVYGVRNPKTFNEIYEKIMASSPFKRV